MSRVANAISPPYDSRFFDSINLGSLSSARKIVPLVLEMISPRSVVDVGCGEGAWLSAFREFGVTDIMGIDGSYACSDRTLIPRECFTPMNLAKPNALPRTYELAVSLEVAEHLPAEAAPQFINLLTSLANVVLFSAAIPGQGGTHHINEQPPNYWANLFAEHNYLCADPLRQQIWDDPDVRPWFAQNLLVFIRSSFLMQYPGLSQSVVDYPRQCVHPFFFRNARNLAMSQQSMRSLLREIARRVKRHIKSRLAAEVLSEADGGDGGTAASQFVNTTAGTAQACTAERLSESTRS